MVRTETVVDNSTGQAFTPASSETTTGEAGEAPGDDQMLPVTGQDDPASLLYDGRFWGALLIILLLAVGATYRGKWSH